MSPRPFNITVIQFYVPTIDAEEGEADEVCEGILELTPEKDALFIIGDWDAKIRK